MRKTGKNKPEIVTEGVKIRKFWYVNIEITQEENGEWSWEAIPLNPGETSKSQIITKLVEAKYPVTEVSRIIQTYLTNPEDLSVCWEFEALQAWKSEASKIADNVIEAINEHESNL